jgi:hypothetical protein
MRLTSRPTKAEQALGREAWLARYPDLSDQLAAFRAEQDRLLCATACSGTTAESGSVQVIPLEVTCSGRLCSQSRT